MKNKRKLEDLSLDEFLEIGLSESEISDDSDSAVPKKLRLKDDKNWMKNVKKTSFKKNTEISDENAEKSLSTKKNKDADAEKMTNQKMKCKVDPVKQHKKTLQQLEKIDPEFYEFLKKEDEKLLTFGGDDDDDDEDDESLEEMKEESSDSEENINLVEKQNMKEKGMVKKLDINDEHFLSDDDDDDYTDSDEEEKVHKLPEKLEEMSTSEEEEDQREHSRADGRTITLKMVQEWTKGVKECSPIALHQLIQAFRGAVQQAGSQSTLRSNYRVKGPIVFNAIVRTCMTEVPSMLKQFLKFPKQKKPNQVVLPRHSPQWMTIKKSMIIYLTDLNELLSQLAEANILNVVLKHVAQMIPYYASVPKLTKAMLRRLIALWSTGEETTRVIAFLALVKLTKLGQETFLGFVLKQMYMSYVKNSKFTSPSTLPLINFMQCSLVEMFALDHDLTYQYAFVYIRQLAIHLRNAISIKRKDSCQAVYNWQYIHSLNLWTRVVSVLYPSDVLEPVIYPLVQTIIGTIKLVPTARYYPLRFHCVRALNTISEATHTYIPTLPFLVEIFDLVDFNKRPKCMSFKPFNFACILKLSKMQLNEKSFKDGVIDQLYEHILESFHIHAHTIGFPELALPALLQLKKFVKTCKVTTYTKQIKQIIDKVEETCKVITKRRQSVSINLNDAKAVDQWEHKSKEEGTPLNKYYVTWRKLRDRELQNQVAGKERISSDDLPIVQRRLPPASETERKEFSGLFASDSEDDDDASNDDDRFLLKSERNDVTSERDDAEYSDFDEEELEKLAQSASEDSSEEEEAAAAADDDGGDEDDDTAGDDDLGSIDQEDVVEDFHWSSDEDN